MKNIALLESFIYFLKKLCMFAFLESFVCVSWCVHKFLASMELKIECLEFFRLCCYGCLYGQGSKFISELWSLILGEQETRCLFDVDNV